MSYLSPGRFEVIAHRGGSLEAPENTLASFNHAASLYKDIGFELDIHPSADGKIIVLHDPTLKRTTNGTGFVGEMKYAEIAQWDAGYHFTSDGGKSFPFRGRGIKVPLLSEVFEQFPHTRISIELKAGHGFFGQKVIDVIKKYNAQDRVVLASGEHTLLRKTHALAPTFTSGYSGREMLWHHLLTRLHFPFIGSRRGHVLQPPYKHHGKLISSRSFIDRAHQIGKYVHVWTVNDEETMGELIKNGVDGIITDAPQLLLKVAQALKKI